MPLIKDSIDYAFGKFICGQRGEREMFDSVVPFDPQIKPYVDACCATSQALADALRARGIQEVGLRFVQLVETKEQFQNWARDLRNETSPGIMEYVEATDKALVPFLQGYLRNLDGLCDYVKSRFG